VAYYEVRQRNLSGETQDNMNQPTGSVVYMPVSSWPVTDMETAAYSYMATISSEATSCRPIDFSFSFCKKWLARNTNSRYFNILVIKP
jgi:hypothetical protein